MKNQKHIVVVAMVLLAVVGALCAFEASAADVNKTDRPIVDEKITVEMMASRTPNQADWNTSGCGNGMRKEPTFMSIGPRLIVTPVKSGNR